MTPFSRRLTSKCVSDPSAHQGLEAGGQEACDGLAPQRAEATLGDGEQAVQNPALLMTQGHTQGIWTTGEMTSKLLSPLTCLQGPVQNLGGGCFSCFHCLGDMQATAVPGRTSHTLLQGTHKETGSHSQFSARETKTSFMSPLTRCFLKPTQPPKVTKPAD